LISIRKVTVEKGAEISGVDLSAPLAADVIDGIKQAWAGHLVLRFRGQMTERAPCISSVRK
jgi:taurine dioxygenase